MTHSSVRFSILTTISVTFLLFAGTLFAQVNVGRDGFPLPESPLATLPGSDCFISNGTPGCDDAVCEATVCAIDAFCCDVSWDGICAGEAIDMCPAGEEPDNLPRARFYVSKTFTDGNTAEVLVSLDCNTGLILDQDKLIAPGDPVTFIVTDYTDGQLSCTITESVPAGYSATYNPNPGEANGTSCEFENLPWGVYTICSIVNEPNEIEVEIEKEWIIINSADANDISQDFRVDIWCDSEIVGGSDYEGQWHNYAYGDGDDVISFYVIPEYPDTDCTVTESEYESGVETENGCGDFSLSAGDDTLSCKITNTVFFEGVPTLGQYGAVVLALMLLVVGVVGFRRLS
jgi:hypothetical protein